MEKMELYENNERFQKYVDAYCAKHKITPEEAVEHNIVQAVGKQIIQREAEILPAKTEIKVGCGE